MKRPGAARIEFPPEARGALYTVLVISGDYAAWTDYQTMYNTTKDAGDRARALYALAQSPDLSGINGSLNMTLQNWFHLQDVATILGEASTRVRAHVNAVTCYLLSFP